MKRWLRCDFHNHTSLDMEEVHDHHPVKYTPFELIDRAKKLNYDALALTHHDALIFPKDVEIYAKKNDIILIPGIEKTIEGKHVLILNLEDEKILAKIETLSDLKKLPKSILIIAPHPYYVLGSCLMRKLEEHIDCFDAIEWNAWYCFGFNYPNRKARRIATKYNKALVGNSDTHELFQFGTTRTLVYAEKHADSIIDAIKHGKTKLETKPMSLINFTKVIISRVLLGFLLKIVHAERKLFK